jgi:hypothetical protein
MGTNSFERWKTVTVNSAEARQTTGPRIWQKTTGTMDV